MTLTPIVYPHTVAYETLRDIARRARVNGSPSRLYLTESEGLLLAEFDRPDSWLWHVTVAAEFTVIVDDVKAARQRGSWS